MKDHSKLSAELVGELVADVDCGIVVLVVFADVLVEVVVEEVREAEEVVEDAVAATTNLFPNASARVESMRERKKVLPEIANDPGVQEYELDSMLTRISMRPATTYRGALSYSQSD
jgi:hypothetical protein